MFDDDRSRFGGLDWREEFVDSRVHPFLASHRSDAVAGVRKWLKKMRAEWHPLTPFAFVGPEDLSVTEGWAVLFLIHDLACFPEEQIEPTLEDLDQRDRVALATLRTHVERLQEGDLGSLEFVLDRANYLVNNPDENELRDEPRPVSKCNQFSASEGGTRGPSGRRPRKKPCHTRVAQERIKTFIEKCRKEGRQRLPTIAEICAATGLARGTVSQSQHYREYASEFERSASATHRTIPLTDEILASRPDGRSADPADIAIDREEAANEEIWKKFLGLAETSEERHRWAAASPEERRAVIDRLRAQDRERSPRR